MPIRGSWFGSQQTETFGVGFGPAGSPKNALESLASQGVAAAVVMDDENPSIVVGIDSSARAGLAG